MERAPKSPGFELKRAWGGQMSPTLIARLSNTIPIPSPRRSIFPRSMTTAFDNATAVALRLRLALSKVYFTRNNLIVAVFALFTILVVVVVFIVVSPMAITEVEYMDCSRSKFTNEDCLIVRVPAGEYVQNPIVLSEPRFYP